MIKIKGIVIWKHFTGTGRPKGSSVTEFECEKNEIVSHLNGLIKKKNTEKNDTVFTLENYKITEKATKTPQKKSQ